MSVYKCKEIALPSAVAVPAEGLAEVQVAAGQGAAALPRRGRAGRELGEPSSHGQPQHPVAVSAVPEPWGFTLPHVPLCSRSGGGSSLRSCCLSLAKC